MYSWTYVSIGPKQGGWSAEALAEALRWLGGEEAQEEPCVSFLGDVACALSARQVVLDQEEGRYPLGVEAEERLWLVVQQAQAAEIYEKLMFCQRKQTYKCL